MIRRVAPRARAIDGRDCVGGAIRSKIACTTKIKKKNNGL